MLLPLFPPFPCRLCELHGCGRPRRRPDLHLPGRPDHRLPGQHRRHSARCQPAQQQSPGWACIVLGSSAESASPGTVAEPCRVRLSYLASPLADHRPADVGGHNRWRHRRRRWGHRRHLLHCFGEQHCVPQFRRHCNCGRSCGPLCSHWTVLQLCFAALFFRRCAMPGQSADWGLLSQHSHFPPANNRPPAQAQPLLALPPPQQPQAPSREAAHPAPALRAAVARPPQVSEFGCLLAGGWTGFKPDGFQNRMPWSHGQTWAAGLACDSTTGLAWVSRSSCGASNVCRRDPSGWQRRHPGGRQLPGLPG